ncbi:ATP-binding protein [Paraburkholderia sediminicola]|uniref:ATP-binding protein n=1 Tax=Paraburkholderia sediminicola TaxID=458836 RepID=UPI000FF435B4
MKFSSFVGRSKELERLRHVLLRDDPSDLVIQSIEGPGGIGKTSFFDKILGELNLHSLGFLILRIDGNKRGNASLDQLIGSLIDSAKPGRVLDKPMRTIFSRTADAISSIERIRSESIELLRKQEGGEDRIPELIRLYDFLVSAGKTLNSTVPASKDYVNAEALEKASPEITETLEKLGFFKEDAVSFWDKFGLGDSALVRKIKQNAPHALAQCLADDLKQIMVGKTESGEFQPGFGVVKGLKRLLLIVDDYESLQSVVSEFLISNFLMMMKDVGFAVTVVILGRDRLSATHPSWDQHHSSVMANSLQIKPLSKDEMNELLEKLDVHDPVEKERAWTDTRGYPFYVTLWANEWGNGGRSAVMLKQFYSRITRWMTDRQRGWLDQVIHMRDINLATLKAVFGAEEAREVMTWFENEASVRDTNAKSFTVNEYARSRLLEYLALRDPDGHETLAIKAARAGT